MSRVEVLSSNSWINRLKSLRLTRPSARFMPLCYYRAFSPARPAGHFMDLRSIRYFVQIADCGGITRAAASLGVAQPALTRHVQTMEAELGLATLVRPPRGVRLTGAGRQFLDHCRRALRELDRAKDELRANVESPRGEVILGVSPTLGPLLVPGIVERTRRQCPQVALKIVEHFS